MEKIYLDIKLDADKKTVASILVMSGYTVKVETVENGKGRAKKMLAFWKEEEK